MDSLPTEVLVHIFSYLRPYDRLEASLVCKRWLQVNDCFELLKDIYLTFSEYRFLPYELSRSFPSFKFRTVIVSDFVEFLHHMRSQIYYLSLNDCIFNTPFGDLDGKIDFLNNLKILEISNSDGWCLFSSLPQLVELHIYDAVSISDSTFLRFKDMMQNLRVFHISCDIAFDQRAYKRFYPNEANVVTNPSSIIFSFPAIEFFIRERARTLQSLGFDNTAISAAALTAISRIENLTLRKISLRNCNECGKGLVDLFHNQPQLKEVDLNGVREIKSEVVKSICLLPNIRKIKVSNSQYITRFSAERILQLPKLEAVDFSSCKDITVNGFDYAVLHLKAFKLRSINLSSCNIGHQTLTTLIKSCKYLTFLDLSDCAVTDQNVNEISGMLTLLRYLRLSRCRDITDSALTGNLTREMEAGGNEQQLPPGDLDTKKSVDGIENQSPSGDLDMKMSVDGNENHSLAADLVSKMSADGNENHSLAADLVSKMNVDGNENHSLAADLGCEMNVDGNENHSLTADVGSKVNVEENEDLDSKINVDGNKNVSLSNIRGLQELYLNECHQITDVGVVNGLKLQELHLLDIRGCRISNRAEFILEKQNPSLKIIIT